MPEVQSIGLDGAQDASFTPTYSFDVTAAMSLTSQVAFIDNLVSNWNGNEPETTRYDDMVWTQNQIKSLQ
jgi:hypothetical protein